LHYENHTGYSLLRHTTMAKSVEQIEKALKLKAQSKPGSITIRVGVKKYVLPFDARVLTSKDFMFVHIPPAAGIFSIGGKEAGHISEVAKAEEAAKSFRSRKGRGAAKRSGKGSVEVPDDVKAALAKIPAGYKLVNDAKGARLVKTRARSK
jgi:hypothetical protein